MIKEKITQMCSIENCKDFERSRTYCNKHYKRWLKYGDVEKVKLPRDIDIDPYAKFWSRVCKGQEDECWEWQNGRDGNHYGQVTIYGVAWATHRLAYYLSTQIIPSMNILHSCDNHRCCNPKHLREGTYAENSADMIRRDRQNKGEERWNARFTNNDVRSIKLRIKNGEQRKILAREYNVHRSTIDYMIRGVNWKHIDV